MSLFVEPGDVARGRFTLAPLYDMLPMHWRPDAISGEIGLLPLTPDPIALASSARPIAREFWERVTADSGVSRAFRALASKMAGRMR